MNGIVENLLAAGVLAGGQRLVDLLAGGEGELRKACRVALVRAVTETVYPESDHERDWLVQVIGDGLADNGVPTRITQGGHGALELGTEAFGRRLAEALPDPLRNDLAERLNIDVDRLVERFGWILVEEIRRAALAPRSRLQTLASRLEASQLQEAVGRVGHYMGLEDGDVARRLDELQRLSHDRMIRRLEAVGIPAELTGMLATELAIPDTSGEVATKPLRAISDEVGAGKSTGAERLHLAAIERARHDLSAPLPVFVEARNLNQNLVSEVERWWHRRELADRGLDLVVDGLEEVGVQRAGDLVLDVRSLLRRWPKSLALVVHRPIAVDVDEGQRLPIPLLKEEEAIAVVARVAGRPIDPGMVHNWSASVREAIRRPLFALAAGLGLGGEHEFVSPIELIDRLARHATSRLDWTTSLPVLGRAAAASVDAGHHPVPVSEVTRTVADRATLAGTTLVTLLPDGTLSWQIVLLAEWFAAQHLLQEPRLVERIVEHGSRLDRWRYALVLAAEMGGYDAAEPTLSSLARRAPAMAGWVLKHAGRRVTRMAPPPYPESEWGRRFRTSMTALTDGLGPLASIIAPVRDGQLLPLGIHATEQWVDLAWNVADRDAPLIGPFPRATGSSLPSDWTGGRGIRLDSHPVFAWKAMYEQLREGFKRALDSRQFLVGSAVLQDEADWRLALDLLGRSTVRVDPITLRELHDRIAPYADEDDRTGLQYGGRPAVRLGDVRALLRRLQDQGQTAITCPWPGPDRLGQGIGWLPHLWSPEVLRRRAEGVATTALACYKATVDQWLPRFAPQLHLAAAWPVRFTGYVYPGDPTRGMDDSASFIRTITSDADGPGADFQIVDDVGHALSEVRAIADASKGLKSYSWGDIPGIYGLTPATDLAARLLWDDLKAWEWVSGSLRMRH
jgi:hypothetical protein